MNKEEKVKLIEERESIGLQNFMKTINKDFGKGTVINAAEKQAYGDVIPTTPFSLGNSLGIGGFAKRKFYTIDGDLSSGKSTTAYDVIANCQKTYNDVCLLIDKEDSYTTAYGEKLGINNDKLIITSPHTLEDMYGVLIEAIKSNIFGVIVVDSQTAFAPAARFEDSSVLGLEARINSDKMRLVMNALERSNTCLIFLMQTRQKLGSMGDPTTVSGGTAIPFYAHCRIRITRSKIDRENGENIIKFTIIKNKLSSPFKVGTVVYNWETGFDLFSEVADLAIEFGIIKNEGKSYFFPDTDVKEVGKKKAIQYLKDNPEYTKEVIQPMLTKFLSENTIKRDDESDGDISK